MKNFSQALIISVDMGYGHQRTAFPLRHLGEIINANDYLGIPSRDGKIWKETKIFYEFISNFKKTPLVGNSLFSFFNRFQRIEEFYPKRDLSKPNIALKIIYSLFKKGWGKDLIEKLKAKKSVIQAQQTQQKSKINLPIISAFFLPALMAEFFNYPGDIYCVICDVDISRPCAALNPRQSKIKYFVPTERTAERLKSYGVKNENIFLTGYPLPKENIGSSRMEILKEDLKERILNLAPQKKFFKKYQSLLKNELGDLPNKSNRNLTLCFSIGGAGAQKEMAIKVLESLKKEIEEKKLKLILSIGIKKETEKFFKKKIEILFKETPENLEIIYQEKIEDYFKDFNKALRKTDILITKPSELSFYSALGLPVLILPPIGYHEEFNKDWLIKNGFGIEIENLKYIKEWLFDFLNYGFLAEAAFRGYLEGEKLGIFKIETILKKIE